MTTKSIRYALLSILAGIGLTACVDQPFEDMHVEMFNRDFIKEFGAIDPNQDWNMATSADVKVNIGDRADAHVKMYAKYKNKYYLVADLHGMTGEFSVPVDIPKETVDLLVKIDDTAYLGTTAGIDCTGAPTSRAILTDAGDTTDNSAKGETHTSPQFSVNVQWATSGYEYFNAQQIAPITSTENWTKYYTLNKETAGGTWRINPEKYDGFHPEVGKGVLPENGILNQPYNKRPTGDSFYKYDFTLKMTNPEEGFDIFPYFYGTDKQHDLFIYFVDAKTGKALEPIDADGNVVDPSTITEANEKNYKPKLYPIFRDAMGDDLQIYKRPFTNVQSIDGVWIYEYIERDSEDPNSFRNIGKLIATETGDQITLAPNQKVWIFPIINATYPYSYGNGATTYTDPQPYKGQIPLDDFLRCTTLPRMEWADVNNGQGEKIWFNNQPTVPPFYVSKRGLAFIGNAKDNNFHNFVIAVQDYDGTNHTYNWGKYKTLQIKVAEGGIKLRTEAQDFYATKTVYLESYDTNCGGSREQMQNLLRILNNGGDHSFSIDLAEGKNNVVSNASTFQDAFLAAWSDNALNGITVFQYEGNNHPTLAMPSPNDYNLTKNNIIVNGGDNWLQLRIDFIEKTPSIHIDAMEPSDIYSPPEHDVYNNTYINKILNYENIPDVNLWSKANVDYDPYRPVGEETSSYYTEVPMLCRTHGYTLKIMRNGKSYEGLIGFAMRNVYKSNADDYFENIKESDFKGDNAHQQYLDAIAAAENSEFNFKNPNSRWHEFYTYSQSRYNDWTYDATNHYNAYSPYDGTISSVPGGPVYLNLPSFAGSRTFNHNYAVRIKHPISDRDFFAFEDWEIAKPVGDTSVDNYLFNDNYNDGYNFGTHTGVYSSDRDYNDLIFRVDRAILLSETGDDEIFISDERIPWLWVLEDLGSTGDYDFNDVIVRITSVTTTKTTTIHAAPESGEQDQTIQDIVKCVTFQPVCAGGVMPIHLRLEVDYSDNTGDHDIVDYCLSPGEYDISKKGEVKDGDGNTLTLKDHQQDLEAEVNGVKYTYDAGTLGEGLEYHRWFGIEDNTKMINTGAGPRVMPENIKRCVLLVPTTFKVNDGKKHPDYTTVDAYKHPFYALVTNTIEDPSGNKTYGKATRKQLADTKFVEQMDKDCPQYIVDLPEPGYAPQSFIIAGASWTYACEYQHILDAYPTFKNWVKNVNDTGWIDGGVNTYLYHFLWDRLAKGASALTKSQPSSSGSDPGSGTGTGTGTNPGTQSAPQVGNASTNQFSQLRRR